jgi:very-short-patch-repair endonuclease
LSSEYKSVGTHYEWKCSLGHRWSTTARNIQKGCWCPKCGGYDKKSLEFYDNIARGRGGRCLSTEYFGANAIYEWRCSSGHEWKTTANSVQRGTWCSACAGLDKKDMGWVRRLASGHEGSCLSTQYIDALSKYEWECKEGHRWTATASHVQQGTWCPICGGRNRKDLEWLRGMALSQGGKCLSIEYINSAASYDWECQKGHRWATPASNIQQGHWCPYCTNRKSKLEIELFEVVRLQHPDALNRVRGLLRNKRFELDIYIPSLKKAIEFDGDYHHSRPGAAERDARKNAGCVEAGIELFRVRWSSYVKDREGSVARVFAFLASP